MPICIQHVRCGSVSGLTDQLAAEYRKPDAGGYTHHVCERCGGLWSLAGYRWPTGKPVREERQRVPAR